MQKGIGVSEGYGIGKAVVIKEVDLDYSSVSFSTPEGEKQRLQEAVAAFKAETEQMVETLTASAGAKQAEILQGHIEMISDPFMVQQMEEAIDGGAVAEAAADTVCQSFHDMFAASGDELLM